MNDTAVSIIAVLVFGAIICFFVYFLLPARKKDADKIPEDKFDATKFKDEVSGVRLKGDTTLIKQGASHHVEVNVKPSRNTTSSRTKATLDYLYATNNGLWVCPFCETLNTSKSTHCVACGKNQQLEESLKKNVILFRN